MLVFTTKYMNFSRCCSRAFDPSILLLNNFYKNVKLLYQRTETNLVLSVIHPEHLDVIWGERKNNTDTQNIIAVCSDLPVTEVLPNLITLDIDNSYLTYQKNYSDLVKSTKDIIKVTSDYKNVLTELNSKIEGLKIELEQKQNKIDLLKSENAKQYKKIVFLENKICSNEKENHRLKQELQGKQTTEGGGG